MANPLNVTTELSIDGAWVDVTDDVFTRKEIEIKRGRSDWADKVDRSTCSLTFNNRLGTYSPRNPLSPYFGKIGRNTPIRVALHQNALNLTGAANSRASTPDHASLDITGDIDIRVKVSMDDWTPAESAQAFVGKAGFSFSSYYFAMTAFTQRLSLSWHDAANDPELADATEETGFEDGSVHWVRVTLDVDNGAGGHTVTFYTSENGSVWSRLGDPVTEAGTTSIFASSRIPEIGSRGDNSGVRLVGQVFYAEIRDGIDGEIVANPDFSIQTPGDTSFTDGTGKVWTVHSPATIEAAAVGRVRFAGEVSEWPQRWDMSGNDIEAPVEASGILRRMLAGSALHSALYRFTLGLAPDLPLAYWPCEDGENAARIANPIGLQNRMIYRPGNVVVGGSPLADPSADVDFGSDDGPPGSDGGIVLPVGWEVVGRVPIHSASAFTIEFWTVLTTTSQVRTLAVAEVGTGRIVRWRFTVSASQASLIGSDVDNTTSDPTHISLSPEPGPGLHHIAWTMEQVGSDFRARLWVDGLLHFTFSPSDSTEPVNTLSRVIITNADASGDTDLYLSHITVWDHVYRRLLPAQSVTEADLALRVAAGAGYAGETAGDRFVRLCTEEGIEHQLYGESATSVPMGPQLAAPVVDLLTQVAESDGGILYEQREVSGLAYRTRETLYNQDAALTLDYANGDVAGIEPTEDDQGLVNDVTVTRQGGSSARHVEEAGPLSVQAPPDGVGRYDDSVTLSLADDDRLTEHAAWRVHLGTVDEARYPVLGIRPTGPDFVTDPVLAAAANAIDIGDKLEVINPPDWLPPENIAQIAQGFTETLGTHQHDIAINCSPESPWRIGILEDEVLGKLDTDGCTLNAAVAASATLISVHTTTGPSWTEDPAEFPFDVVCAGELMTVTAIITEDPFFPEDQVMTVVRSVNGISKILPGGSDIRLAHPLTLAL